MGFRGLGFRLHITLHDVWEAGWEAGGEGRKGSVKRLPPSSPIMLVGSGLGTHM